MEMTKLEKKFVNSERHAKGNVKTLERMLQKINLQRVQRVLEIGCGTGSLSAYMSKTYQIRVIGTDIDPKQIELALRFYGDYEQLKFQTASATNLPFQAETFDLVMCFKVLHHIPDWQKALEEVNRVLKSGGYFLLNDLQGSTFMVRLLKKVIKKYGLYTLPDIIKHLEQKQFQVLHVKPPRGLLIKHFEVVFQKQP